MIEPAAIVELLSRSSVEFKKSVKKAIGNLGGLEEIIDCLDEESLKVLEEDVIPTGALGNMMGSLIINWAEQTYPELPEPSFKVALWRALVKSGRKPVDTKALTELLSYEYERGESE